jgi:hypothetical protein
MGDENDFFYFIFPEPNMVEIVSIHSRTNIPLPTYITQERFLNAGLCERLSHRVCS